MFEKAILLHDYLEYISNRGASQSYADLNKKIMKNFINNNDIQDAASYVQYLTEKTVNKRQFYVYDILLKFVEYHKDSLKDYHNIKKAVKNFKRQEKESLRQSTYLDNDLSDMIIKRLSTKKHALIAWIKRDTGARAGDVLRLTKDRVKFEPVKLSNKETVLAMSLSLIKKGGRVSKVFIYNNKLAEYIEQRLLYIDPNEDYVFIDRKIVNKYNRNDIQKLMNRNYYLYWQVLKRVCY